jgi:hypothetical protein
MSLVKDTWRQIVQRRLWPVVILLLAALVAVPMLLAKSPAATPLPAPASPTGDSGASATDIAMTKPVVSVASGDDARRHVIGVRKDVFRPEVIATPTPTSVTKTSTSTTSSAGGASAGGSSTPITVPSSFGGGSSSGSSSTPGTTGTGTGTGTGTAKPRKRSFPGDSLTVRWSDGTADGTKALLRKDESLPNDGSADTQPLLVYLGLDKGGKSAQFLLDESIKATGDGRCDGAGSTCGTLHLRAGDTEFLDVTDDTGAVTASYELDVLSIHASKKTKAAAARIAAARHGAQASVVRVAGAAAKGASAHQLGRGVAALLRSL